MRSLVNKKVILVIEATVVDESLHLRDRKNNPQADPTYFRLRIPSDTLPCEYVTVTRDNIVTVCEEGNMSDKKQPDSGAQRPGKGASDDERTKSQPKTDPRNTEPKGPKHGHGRGSGGGV